MIRKLILLFTAALLLVWSAGCSKNPVEEKTTTDVSAQFDGLTPTAEAPAFGDPVLASAESEEQVVDDPMAATPRFDSLMNDPNAGIFHFRAVWGRLLFDSTSTAPTNWDGAITVSRGLAVVRRIIRFEPRTDSLLPRTQRNLIEWASTTTTHNDGIAVDLLIPPIGPTFDTTVTTIVDSLGGTTTVITIDTIPAADVTVEFKTGPYTRVFTLPELARLDTIVYIEDPNADAFSAFELVRLPCPRGFLAGHWGFDSTGTGVFRGMWVGAHGAIDGFLQGHFMVDTSGARLFFGKWIDNSGRFEGLLRGRWGQHPDDHASDRGKIRGGGWFAGQIYDANANPIGLLHGKYKGENDLDKGFFQGRWKLYCPNVPSEQDGMESMPSEEDLE